MSKSKSKNQKKNRLQANHLQEESFATVPHSFVFHRGLIGKNVSQLVLDMRRIMQPFTAEAMKVKKKNVLKDFVSIAGPLGVTHFMIFSKTPHTLSMRLARVPRGPMLHFKVIKYALVKDVISSLKRHRMHEQQFTHHPLLILNNFGVEGMHVKLMATMFQNMFPSINVHKVNLNSIKRCVLLNYDPVSQEVELRHYSLKVVPVGMSRGVKKLMQERFPNMNKFEDISELLMKGANLSESEAELDGDHNITELPQACAGRGNMASQQSAVRLTEIGPRMTLKLMKIQEGMGDGDVLYHAAIFKTEEELQEILNRKEAQLKEKDARRKKQAQNVAEKLAKREQHKNKSLEGIKRKREEEEDSEVEDPGVQGDKVPVVESDDEAEYYRQAVGQEPEEGMFPPPKKRRAPREHTGSFARGNKFHGKPPREGGHGRSPGGNAPGKHFRDRDSRSPKDHGPPPGGYGTMPRLGGHGPAGMDRRRLRSCEDTLDGDMGGVDPYVWGVPGTMERGSMASLDSTLRKGPPPSWRQPELPEVIAMLNYRLDPVKTNAAAYLQHLTFKNDKVKSDVRRLKGIPALVSMLDHPKKEVHHSACGALKNISFGRDADNKIAIKNCDGVTGLVRLLRKTHEQDLTDTITGTLWNLSSHDVVKMEIVDHALHALSDEVMVPRSGWERSSDAGEENCKPRHLEWETALTNTAGCLRNVSSERSEARRKLRECTGLVDSLMYIVQSQINRKDVDNKLVENSVCLLRNLSYHVHREIPGCERFSESVPLNQGPAPGSQKGSCFSSKKGKGKKDDDDDGSGDQVDIPKRTTAAKGYELLYQPEVVRLYTSLLRESKNASVLEAAAGAIQNLCAGRWTYGRYIRATVRLEKGLPMMAELLAHGNDRVVRAMSGALRNLAIDNRNKELLGKHAVPHLVADLPGGPAQSARPLSEETVVSVLSTLAEVLGGGSLEAAKTLRTSQGIERLVLISKDGKRSEREVRAAGQVLQLVWGHKELRRPLEKDGWKKADFAVNLSGVNGSTNGGRANGSYDDGTLPLLDRGEKRDMIPLNDLGPEGYTTLEQKERRHTLEHTTDTLPRGVYGPRKGSLPLLDSYDG